MSKFMFALVLIYFMFSSIENKVLQAASFEEVEDSSMISTPLNHIQEEETESTKPILIIRAVEETRLYTQDNPTFRFTIVNDPTVPLTDIDVLPTATCAATRSSSEGDYEIMVTGGSDDVYDIQVQNSWLHVKKLISSDIELQVIGDIETAYAGTKIDIPYEFTPKYYKGTHNEIILNYEVIKMSVTYEDEYGNKVEPVNVGQYWYEVKFDDDNVIEGNKIFGFLTITKAPLEIGVTNVTKEQGKANPPIEYTFKGFVNGETKDVIDQLPTINNSVDKSTVQGSYDITLSGGKDDHYDIKTTNGKFTVTGPSVAVDFTMDDKNVTYNGTAHGVAVTITPSDFTYELTYNGSSKVPKEVGTYEVIAKCTDKRAGSNIGYTKKCVLVIQKATIYITAHNKECYFGEEIPPLTRSFDGFVGEDNSIAVSPSISCAANKGDSPGEYDIILVGGSDPNYNIHLTNGKLTIKNKKLVITFGQKEFEYDGEAKEMEVTTDPEGIAIEITYNDSHELPVASGQYTVMVKSLDPNYQGQEQITMAIWSRKEEMDVVNAIIDDGTNETLLRINNIDAYANNSLILYDRAGHMLFQSVQEYQNDYDLKPLHEGTYFYLFSYEFNGEKVYEKRFIELIRP
ncbi:MBG domain-containing protein [Halosquirtibacter xylanolyticus]|uniref:MBG domain-containing protein n=1 Tax=Halosquirtibacter xylanolyticus TaxID=3374599 RepID=UPI003748EB50|nr:MBG domain-containing protein [Prolixibacteraceae bacterium]